MMSVVQEIHRYARQHYGNLISIGEPRFDERAKTWSAELKSDYPHVVHDDRSPNERILKFLSLRRLGEIKFGENLQPIESTTSRETCIKNLTAFLAMWRERAERIIVMVSSDQLARINEAQRVLAKVGMIISNLLHRERISEEDIAFFPPKQERKMIRYLRFLEDLDLVRKIDGGYTYGNLFSELQVQTQGNIPEFYTAILSHIIRTRYSALRETFNISQLEPFVHVDSCYYRPTLEAEKILYLTSDSIINHYTKFYRSRKSPMRIRYILEELVNAKALEREDKYYFGNEELFSQMLDLKSQMAELGSPRA